MQIEDGLTERILDAIGNRPGDLPLLEFALTLLWEKQRKRILSHRGYEEIGGVEKALAKHAEVVFDQLNPEEQPQAQRIFIQLVQPGEGAADTRRLATRTEIGEENWELVTRLANAGLVVSGRDEVRQTPKQLKLSMKP